MKWAPTLVVLGAFCVLLYMTRSKPAQEGAPATTAAHAPAAGPGAQAPAGSAQGAPHATTTPAEPPGNAARRADPRDEGPAVEVVKPAQPATSPPPRRPNSIAGIVKDPAGNGVSQIEVRLVEAGGREVASRRTDGSGRFNFENVAPGAYTLSTWDPDFLYTTRAQTSVTAKQDGVADAELRVDRGTARVSGIVTDGGGRPLADKRVALTAGGAEFSVTTDAKGRFVVSGLAPGEWQVIADGIARHKRIVKLDAGATTDVELALPRGAALEVTVSGSQLHPAEFRGGEKVLLRSGSKSLKAELVADAAHGDDEHAGHSFGTATARFADVEPGEWELEVVGASGATSLVHHGAAWSEPITITLREGERRVVALPTAVAALGRGTEVATWIKIVMIAGISLLVLVTPILFPPPLVPRPPPARAASGSAAS